MAKEVSPKEVWLLVEGGIKVANILRGRGLIWKESEQFPTQGEDQESDRSGLEGSGVSMEGTGARCWSSSLGFEGGLFGREEAKHL